MLKGGDSSFATGFDLRVHRNAEVFIITKYEIKKIKKRRIKMRLYTGIIQYDTIRLCLRNLKTNIQLNQQD